MTTYLVLALLCVAVGGWAVYRQVGWPGVAALVVAVAGAVLALLGVSGRRKAPEVAPPPQEPHTRAVSRTAGQIIEEREAKAREAIAAAESPEDVAAIMGRQK